MMELMTINKDCKLNKIKAGDNFHQFFFFLSRTPTHTHTHTHSLPVLLPVFFKSGTCTHLSVFFLCLVYTFKRILRFEHKRKPKSLNRVGEIKTLQL